MNLIKTLPIPIAGLVLALLCLGNLLYDIHPGLKILFGGLGCIFLALIMLKAIFYFDAVRQDFQNPVIVSSSGTFSMSLMILSTYLIPYTASIAYALWIIGIALHIMLMIYFTCRFIIRDFDITNVYPTYWIVFVGITMGAITSQTHAVEEIGFLFFAIGFLAMVLTLPLVVYRYVKYPEIPDMNKPLICIFTAVLSILIEGYLNSAQNPSREFIMILYPIACLFYVFALYKFIDYRNLDFYPSFAAFTFPFVISALATKGVGAIIQNSVLNYVLLLETAIAVMVVVYVLIKYLKFLKIVEVDG